MKVNILSVAAVIHHGVTLYYCLYTSTVFIIKFAFIFIFSVFYLNLKFKNVVMWQYFIYLILLIFNLFLFQFSVNLFYYELIFQ